MERGSRQAELLDAGASVEISVFRGDTAESGSLLERVVWAVKEVLRQAAERGAVDDRR